MFVSVILSCRNEEKFIAQCLDSLVSQTYPKENIELLLVDGASEDVTKNILESYAQRYSFVKVLDNPQKFFSAGNNVGIKNAKGDLIVILGAAHATYPAGYIEKRVTYSKKYNVDCVGGNVRSLPKDNTAIAKVIAFSFEGLFGRYSVPVQKEDVVLADTVFGGCYKKEVFEKIGLFNDNLKRTSDLELNLRLRRNGGTIYCIKDDYAFYYPKASLEDYFAKSIEDGVWNIMPSKFTKKPLQLRHYLPLVFLLTLPVSLWFYLPISFFFAVKTAVREKDADYLLLPIASFTRHLGHGIGCFIGVLKLAVESF